MNFLPTNYAIPKGDSNYYKLESGENTFRILSPATVGWKYWTDEAGSVLEQPIKGCKSVYVRTVEEAKQPARHFWSFVVCGQDEAIQVFEITQITLMQAIHQYLGDTNWNNPQEYDFVITKSGTGKDTKYQIRTNPKAPLKNGVLKLYEDMQLDLSCLFQGEDPFKPRVVETVDPETAKQILTQ